MECRRDRRVRSAGHLREGPHIAVLYEGADEVDGLLRRRMKCHDAVVGSRHKVLEFFERLPTMSDWYRSVLDSMTLPEKTRLLLAYMHFDVMLEAGQRMLNNPKASTSVAD